MPSSTPAPFFPTPPGDYDRQYMAQLVRAFSVFVQQVNNPGPIRGTTLTLHPSGAKIDTGVLSYNIAEDTFDLKHLHSTQQIGFETYMRVINNTGSTIPDGSVVGFAGVNGEIQVMKYIANGSIPDLYFIGVTTFEMLNGDTGPVTVYGKVRGLNTTGAPVGETWVAGDILYASPTMVGKFTKVRPTAPNEVVAVAFVTLVSATAGEIVVRPVVPIGLDYGSFSDNTTQTLAAIDTPTLVKMNTTDFSHGVSIVNDGSGNPTKITVTDAGLYQLAVATQHTSSNASQKDIQVWLRKNGTDVPNSNSIITLYSNGASTVFSTTYIVSLLAGEFMQVVWSANSTATTLQAFPASGFSPAIPSIIASLTQIQL